jgi:hypothetical protein
LPGAPRPPARPPKNPWAAVLFSFVLPGLGQVYNGQIAKALVFFSSFVGAIMLASSGAELPFAFVIPFVFFFGLIDAYRSAVALNARVFGGVPEPEESGTDSPVWGVTLVVLGLLFLAHNLRLIDFREMQRFWPILLIGAGAWFITSSVRRREAGRGSAARDTVSSDDRPSL